MSDLELTMMRRVGELNKEVAALKAENTRLKTEVQHLMVFCNCTLIPNKELQAQVERLDTLCKQLGKQHSDISCENIMLRKAGDAMASSIQFNEEMAQDYNGPTIVHQSVQRWNAAKEGKGQP
jgi:predicted RNase H-like nuclease (RuvC/YqgF family)